MARVSTYLNFGRHTEQAFAFYRKVFKTEFSAPHQRFGAAPPAPGQTPLPEADRNLIMHAELPILGGHVLMGTDAPESMGIQLVAGNRVYLNLEPDTRAEAKRLFDALSAEGKVEMPAAGHVLGRVLRQPHRPVRRALDGELRQQGLTSRLRWGLRPRRRFDSSASGGHARLRAEPFS